MQPRHQRIQAIVDKFYLDNGPCCAGCDWWRWHNSVAGESNEPSGLARVSAGRGEFLGSRENFPSRPRQLRSRRLP